MDGGAGADLAPVAESRETSHRGGRAMSRGAAAARAGIGFGTALAIAISWTANKSILWGIVHGFFGWAYVIYYAIRYQ